MAEGPRIGKDEWVARSGENIERHRVVRALDRVPGWARLALFVVAVASIPLITDDGYINVVVFDTLIFCLLAIGLNVVVGWGGLLDLGYIAFFGIGAYTYAILSSDKFDIHLSSLLVMVICVVLGALLGLLVGLPSWRLSGDYLAIVTLFVYQIFISIVTNGHDLFGVDLTGGVNGIANFDPFDLFGREIPVSHQGIFNSNYVYIALGVFVVVFAALYLVNNSRIGRAWRALREDTLAAELMGMPTDWLKLLAFSFGAAVAALTGSLFASLKIGVFPETFSLTLLITVYAMLILGGVGSQTGAVLGAVVVYVFLEALRDPDVSGWVFYIAIVLALVLVDPSTVDGRRCAGGHCRVRVRRPRDRRCDRRLVDDVRAPRLGLGHAVPGRVGGHPHGARRREDDRVRRARRPGHARDHREGHLALGRARAHALPRRVRLGERDVGAAGRDAVRAPRGDARRRHGDEAVRDPR